jgi:predicted TPR repeat methyltransferase
MARDQLQIALEHHRGGRLRQAAAGYRALLTEDADNADAMHWLGVLLLQAGRPADALPLLARAAERRPGDAAFQHNAGQGFLAAGRVGEAIEKFERARALDASNPETWVALASSYVARDAPGDAQLAVNLADEALAAGVDAAELHHLRAVALLKLKRAPEAITAARAAIERKPDHASAHHHLGVALRATGATAEARQALHKAVEVDPAFARAWHGLGVMEAEEGKLEAAAEMFRRAIEAKPDYSAAAQALTQVLTRAGRAEEAHVILKEAAFRAARRAASPAPQAAGSTSDAIADLEAKLTPEGRASQMHYALATLLNVFPPAQSPASGVTKLFDDYAERFDKHLGKLDYRVPEMLAAAVAETRPDRLLDVLDLGCGTGLCGAALRPLARGLHGVDLAPAMIAKSAERGVYDELTQGEMLGALRAHAPATLDLIVATDVLIYVGDLAPVFEGAADALRPGGLLAFSVEASAGDRYHLQPTRRYAHSQPYVERLARIYGFNVERFDTIPVRMEAGRRLAGYLVLLRVPSGDASTK